MKYAPRPRRIEMFARVRRLASLRVGKFGPTPVAPDEWWRQINAVAAEHGLDVPTFEQWHDAPNVDQWEDLP